MKVKIHYLRLPDRTTIFENELIFSGKDVIVTVMRETPLPKPMIIKGKTVFEDGAPAVWFTFPDVAYDIGRFHTRAGEFTGIYANILTPVEFVSDTEWRTTDLFVDVWIGADGCVEVLDEDELEEAVNNGWINPEQADEALRTARDLVTRHRNGTWPPPVVYDWPIDQIPK